MNGTFENLTAFIDKMFERKTSWTSPGGDCKLLELGNFKIKCNYKNDSPTTPGVESATALYLR